MSDRTLTAALLARLQRHYIKPGDLMPGGMFLPEVTLGSRRADALYVGFFASRGKFLVGHELKVSRADWLHELDQPSKAEAWASNCHAWYLVVPSESIVRREELPHGWGLMVPSTRTKTRMDILVRADVHPDRIPTWEATHALVQRADSIRMDGIIAAREKARDEANAEVTKRVEAAIAMRPENRDKERADRAEKLVADVSEILGFNITANAWRDDDVSIEQLRHSFSHWLAADKATGENLNYRISGLKGARKALDEALDGIRALQQEATSEARQ